jgi:adenylosuccinate lyase
MIPRYSLPQIESIWSDDFKFHRWLDVEIAVTEAWAVAGEVPVADAELIAKNAKIDIPDIMTYIDETHHDVTAFLRSIADSLGEESRWVHLGLTSSDVWDTATSLQMVAAIDELSKLLARLKVAVTAKALEHKDTICVGRTHGVHAEPTTFGLKLAVWVDEISRHEQRLQSAREHVAIGQMSGPVGTHATVPPSVEEDACQRLGLAVAPITTQIIQRDRHAYYLSVLAGVGSSLEKWATEIRGLQRTEILEAEEPFDRALQTGSSSMPHKRNPELCERVCGLARVLRGYAQTGLEDVALWHERDISHSGAERVTLPDSTGFLAYMLHIFSGVMEGLVVYPERMQRNLERTQGLVFSQKVMLALIESGLSREDAYKIVQRNSMRAWDEEIQLRGLLEADTDFTERVSAEQIDKIFDYDAYLIHVDASFRRIGLLN